MSNRLLVVQYCDDVRQEIGNKYSLMGCYSDELIVEALPTALPKLYAHIRAITPIDHPFEKLIVRAFLNDEAIGEHEIPSALMRNWWARAQLVSNGKLFSVVSMMAFVPIAFNERSTLRVDAETEEESLNGSSLIIRARNAEGSANPD